jgi:hypothetical protein
VSPCPVLADDLADDLEPDADRPLNLEPAMDALARWIYPLICLLSLLLVIATAAIDHQRAYPDGNAGGQVGLMLQTVAAQPSAG